MRLAVIFAGLLSVHRAIAAGPSLVLSAGGLSADGLTAYDTVNDITWLADANLAASNRFGLPLCNGSGSRAQSCVNASGSMNYQTAAAWVAALNASDDDALIADNKIAPMVAVLIGNPNQETRTRELPPNPKFADFLNNELVAWVRKNYNVTSDPAKVVVAGSSFGGTASVYAGLRHPETFGNILCRSGSFW